MRLVRSFSERLLVPSTPPAASHWASPTTAIERGLVRPAASTDQSSTSSTDSTCHPCSETTTSHIGTGNGLLSMPSEIRVLIYQFLFADEAFLVDVPVRNIPQMRKGDRFRLITDEHKRLLPGLLCSCHRIRAEALPVYSAIVRPLFCNHKDIPMRPVIPNHYLNQVKMIYVANRRTAYPPIDRMPSLETVVLQRRLQGKPQLHDKITLGKVDVSELLSKGKIRWAWYAEHYWRLCKQAAKKEPKSSRIQLLLDVFVELSDGHRIVETLIDYEKRAIIRYNSSVIDPISLEPPLPTSLTSTETTVDWVHSWSYMPDSD